MARTEARKEIESTLLAVSDDVEELTAKLAALRELDGYVLVPRADEPIVDEYLDTRDRRLGTAHVALRVRRLDGAPRLTLKGPTERRAGPASGRLEIERPWSAAAAGQVLRSLAELGVPLARRTASRAWKKPDDFVRALDLERVQRRETLRKPRDVRRRSGSGRPLAELAIDFVTYTIARRKVRIAEIEVEAKRPEGAVASDRVTEILLARDRSLRPWPHSKLATGLALEALQREAKLDEMLGPRGWLTPRGVDVLSRRLRPRRT